MLFFFIPALLIALLLEGTITTLPLVLLVLLCLTIFRRDGIVFPIGFVAGILLDSLTLHTLGMSSLFFTFMFFLIFLYQRKYEITSYPFVAFAAFFGSLGFLLMFGYGILLWQSIISAIAAVILFGIVKKFSI